LAGAILGAAGEPPLQAAKTGTSTDIAKARLPSINDYLTHAPVQSGMSRVT
jgi:hypothetical protein